MACLRPRASWREVLLKAYVYCSHRRRLSCFLRASSVLCSWISSSHTLSSSRTTPVNILAAFLTVVTLARLEYTISLACDPVSVWENFDVDLASSSVWAPASSSWRQICIYMYTGISWYDLTLIKPSHTTQQEGVIQSAIVVREKEKTHKHAHIYSQRKQQKKRERNSMDKSS